MDTKLIDLRIRNAYELYKKVRNSEIDDKALNTLNEYHSLIDNWKGDPEHLQGISFVENFLVGSHMRAIAADGSAPIKHDNFKHIMTRTGTLKKYAKLFCLRRDHLYANNIGQKIVDVHFTNYVVNHPHKEGPKPIQYTNRILLSIFIEIMTTIAKRGHLENTAGLLGINPEGVAFAKLQIQVRQKVEESLMRQDIGNELTKFSRATIAYHIPDACEESQEEGSSGSM